MIRRLLRKLGLIPDRIDPTPKRSHGLLPREVDEFNATVNRRVYVYVESKLSEFAPRWHARHEWLDPSTGKPYARRAMDDTSFEN